jgi:hypothetical protein
VDLENQYRSSAQNLMGRPTALAWTCNPNDLGLSDILGNTLERVHSVSRDPLDVVIAIPANVPPSPMLLGPVRVADPQLE